MSGVTHECLSVRRRNSKEKSGRVSRCRADLAGKSNPMTESFAELFEQSITERDLRPGAIVMGKIVDIREDVVVVNAGLKSEGIVPIYQFRKPDGELHVEVGDEVEVTVAPFKTVLGKR